MTLVYLFFGTAYVEGIDRRDVHLCFLLPTFLRTVE